QKHLLFASLALLGHFARGSFYRHYLSNQIHPLNLYLVIVEPSGAGKSNIVNKIKDAATKIEKLFPEEYCKPVQLGADITEEMSVVTTLTGHGLRKHLTSQSLFLINDEADVIFDGFGVYDIGNSSKVAVNVLLLKAYDGIKNESRSTGSTKVKIVSAKLSMLVGVVGTKYQGTLSNWSRNKSNEGIHNRMNYLVLKRPLARRPGSDHQDHIANCSAKIPAHIQDLYAKTPTIFPRYCCLFQLLKNVCAVIDECENELEFEEGEEDELEINQNFIRHAKLKIAELFLSTAKRSPKNPTIPILIIEKSTCVAAWTWYSYLFQTALQLFSIGTIGAPDAYAVTSRRKTHEQTLCDFQYNIFMVGALTSVYPDTSRKMSPFHNLKHIVDPLIVRLEKDGILIRGEFLQDTRQRKKMSLMKVPIPTGPGERAIFEKKLGIYNIEINHYQLLLDNCSKPTLHDLTSDTIELFNVSGQLVPHYHKYDQLTQIIEVHLENNNIEAVIVNGTTRYQTAPTSTFFVNSTTSLAETSWKKQSLATTNTKALQNKTHQGVLPAIQVAIQNQNQPSESELEEEGYNDQTDCMEDGDSKEENESDEHSRTEVLAYQAQDSDGGPDLSATKENRAESNEANHKDEGNSNEATKVKQLKLDPNIRKVAGKYMVFKAVLFSQTDINKISRNEEHRNKAKELLIEQGLLAEGQYFVTHAKALDFSGRQKKTFHNGRLKQFPSTTSSKDKLDFLRKLNVYAGIDWDTYIASFTNVGTHISTKNKWRLTREVATLLRTNVFYSKYVTFNPKVWCYDEQITDEFANLRSKVAKTGRKKISTNENEDVIEQETPHENIQKEVDLPRPRQNIPLNKRRKT
ncbi:unnamed protein product, partial [Didymodactylos carnosus]